jgi:phosphoglycolate phosphatase
VIQVSDPAGFSTGIECVLFDLDGTLVDTAIDFVQVLNVMMDEENVARTDEQRIRQTVSDGARGLVRLVFGGEPGQEDFDRRLERLLSLYFEQLHDTGALPYPGIDSLLTTLEQHRIPWGVVTNKPEKYSRRLLQQLQLLERCAVLICPDHVSQRKPDPEGLLLACRTLGCGTERTVYVGDHVRDMQAAKNADLIAVAAAYGYLGDNDRIEDWQADFVIRSAADLQPLLAMLKFT